MAQPPEDIIHRLEQQDAAREQKFRAVLLEQGGPEALAEYDANIKLVRLGITGAKGCWHALSETQRRCLKALSNGPLVRVMQGGTGYNHISHSPRGEVFRIATLRNLIARELAAPDGPITDVEFRIVITERGSFVLKHGAHEGR